MVLDTSMLYEHANERAHARTHALTQAAISIKRRTIGIIQINAEHYYCFFSWLNCEWDCLATVSVCVCLLAAAVRSVKSPNNLYNLWKRCLVSTSEIAFVLATTTTAATVTACCFFCLFCCLLPLLRLRLARFHCNTTTFISFWA